MNDEMEMRETTVNGSQTRRWVVEAGECAALVVQRVARLGIDEAVAPYRRVRMSPEGSFVLACVKGRGRVLLEGKWQRVKEGMVCLAPSEIAPFSHVFALPQQ